MSRARALAAIDPDAAIAAPIETPPTPIVTQKNEQIVFAVTVAPPKPHERWRFLLFYLLVRLAARIVPFTFEFYRPDDYIEDDTDA